jgi:diketogulonate reductase-like aldo/keto reductase
VAIPGASSVAQLESNVAAAELELSPSDIATLDAAAASYRPTTGWASASALLKETARRRLRRS